MIIASIHRDVEKQALLGTVGEIANEWFWEDLIVCFKNIKILSFDPKNHSFERILTKEAHIHVHKYVHTDIFIILILIMRERATVMGWIVYPQNLCWSSNPQYLECDFIWKYDHCSLVKTSHTPVRLASMPIWPLSLENILWTLAYKEKMSIKLKSFIYKPKNTKDCQQTPDVWRDKEGFARRALIKSMALQTLRFHISNLQTERQ